MEPDATVDKVVLRRQLRLARAERRPDGRGDALAARLDDLLAGYAIAHPLLMAGFLPARGEPDVLPSLLGVVRRGGRVIVPRTVPGRRMAWVAWRPGVELLDDRYGLAAPVGPPDPAGPLPAALMLIPALAIDPAGHRLGHGAGYYDRALARLPRWPDGPLRVGVVHPQELLADPLPAQPHDEAVDAALTSDGWRRTLSP